jgi:hypothetical protein
MHWELYVIKIKIALVGNACSGPLSIIRSHDLPASDIRRVVGEIASRGWNPINFDFDNNLIQRCGGLISICFTIAFFNTIGICKHVNATFVGDLSFEIINVEMNFISYNMLFNFNNDTIIRMNIFLHKLMKFVME